MDANIMKTTFPPVLRPLLSLVSGVVLAVSFARPTGAQVQYSIGEPSNEGQYMLELINRARANGGAEATRLGLSGLQEGPPTIVGQGFTIENSAQPLSWNPLLLNAAQAHATLLNNSDQFFLGVSPHTFGGTDPSQRIAGTGYVAATYNGATTAAGFFPGPENVATSLAFGSGPWAGARLITGVLNAHNDLFTDLTVPGRGHRLTTMLPFWREAAVGINTGMDVGQGRTWESLYIVQNFGTRAGGTPLITGVVFRDANGNNFYDPGEGVGGVRVDVPGSNFFAISTASGGYTVPVPGNGNYTATFSGAGVTTRQIPVAVVNNLNSKLDYETGAVVSGAPTSLANISTRLRVETGENVAIGGFIVSGTQPKRVIVRAIGPSLPVAGKLADTTLELVGPNGVIATNDNWRTTQAADIIASTVAPTNDLESAIVATLPANNTGYTAIMRGANGSTGVGLVEIYDLNRTDDSKLANISTRGLVQTGENVVIGGFILVGAESRRLIVRAIGPAVPGRLVDPTLELFNANGTLLASNDNWRETQQAEIIATTVAPTNDLESAIVITLPAAAATTAVVRGKNDSTGVALVEIFALN